MTQISLTHKEVKMICEDYTIKEGDNLIYDDEHYNYLLALSKLDKSDFILFCLYAHYQSERKVAKILGMSRTPIHSQLKKIREQILNNLC